MSHQEFAAKYCRAKDTSSPCLDRHDHDRARCEAFAGEGQGSEPPQASTDTYSILSEKIEPSEVAEYRLASVSRPDAGDISLGSAMASSRSAKAN